MIFVFFHIAAGNAFAFVTRYARGSTTTYFTVGAVNYATAMVVAVTWAVLDGGLTFEWPAIVFGVFQGLVYQTMYIVLFGMIALGGLSVSFTVNRLAVAIPIAGAILKPCPLKPAAITIPSSGPGEITGFQSGVTS